MGNFPTSGRPAGWVAVLALAAVSAATSAADFDLVINNGRVIDPESKLDAVRSVGITGGKIAAISEKPLSGQKASPPKASCRSRTCGARHRAGAGLANRCLSKDASPGSEERPASLLLPYPHMDPLQR